MTLCENFYINWKCLHKDEIVPNATVFTLRTRTRLLTKCLQTCEREGHWYQYYCFHPNDYHSWSTLLNILTKGWTGFTKFRNLSYKYIHNTFSCLFAMCSPTTGNFTLHEEFVESEQTFLNSFLLLSCFYYLKQFIVSVTSKKVTISLHMPKKDNDVWMGMK